MVKIENFDTVLEMAFGLNALFYIFELIPYTEDRLKELFERNQKLYERKVKLTKNTEAFPIGFVIGATYPFHRNILKRLSVIASLILLGILLYSAFYPDLEIGTSFMWALLAFVFGVPLIAFVMHKRAIALAETANSFLEKQIKEAERKADKYEMKIGEQQIIINPRSESISEALSLLTTADVPFLQLSHDNKNTFIKVSGRRKTGFTIQYQENDSQHCYKSKRLHFKDETIEILINFLSGSTEWKDLADWEQISRKGVSPNTAGVAGASSGSP